MLDFGLDGVVLDDVAVTLFSKWDPVHLSIQRLELFKMGRALLWKLVERMTSVEFGAVELAEVVLSSTPERDPIYHFYKETRSFVS